MGAIFNGLFVSYSNRAEFAKALEVANEFMALTEGSNDRIARSTANRMVAVTYRLMGNFRISRPFCERATELSSRGADVNPVWQLTHDPEISARYNMAVFIWHSGEIERSLELESDALQRAAQINHGNTLGFALAYIGCMSAYRRRDFEALALLCNRLIEHGHRHGTPMWEAIGRLYRGRTLVECGGAAAGIDALEQAIAAFDRMRMRIHKPLYLGMLAEAYLAGDRSTDALETLDQAIALGVRTGERCHTAELWRLHSQAALACGTAGARLACARDLRVAIDLARDQGSIMFELRAASDLARLQGAEDPGGAGAQGALDPAASAGAGERDHPALAGLAQWASQ